MRLGEPTRLVAAAAAVSLDAATWLLLLNVDEDEDDEVGVGNASRSMLSSEEDEDWNVMLWVGDEIPVSARGECSFGYFKTKRFIYLIFFLNFSKL